MGNNISGLKDADLQAFLTKMTTGLDGRVTNYGVTAAEFTALENASSGFNDAVIYSDTTETAMRGATQQKRTKKRTAVQQATGLSKKIYANAAVTDQMLAEIGLEPRSSGGARQTPKTPLDFLAIPGTNTAVEFRWKRSGNPGTAIFVLQKWSDGAWVTFALTNKTKTKVSGFPVGTSERFRVLAQVNDEVSEPSNEFVIWPGSEDGLRLAA